MNQIYETRRVRVGEVSEHYGTSKITNSNQATQMVEKHLGEYFESLDCEEFHILCLDTKNKINAIIRITRGTLDASLVHPREVFKAAIVSNSSSIILVHNHPSGDPTPSREDIAVTDRLTEVGKIIGIDVLDHIVYGTSDSLTSIKSL